ncbi:hypothetical protein [Photobacterium sp. BZF1]|uniref:hypothetical protein n=1 Tax=Photobacterium sp. BZF1 TaxID=1904457 RepID=UPI001CA3EC12|nr:hypothetical protein [Photobacterium sp. BZF1]
MKRLSLAAALIATLFASGCTQRVADLTLASSKNVNMNSSGFVEGQRVTGTDQTAVVLFPIGIPNVEEATDNAIEQHPCAVALNDVVVDYGYFSFLFGSIWYDVEGTLVLDTEKAGCEQYRNQPLKNVQTILDNKNESNSKGV